VEHPVVAESASRTCRIRAAYVVGHAASMLVALKVERFVLPAPVSLRPNLTTDTGIQFDVLNACGTSRP